MGYIRTKGIVVHETNTGEADKIITLLTKSHGRIKGFAKGARRPRSSMMAGTQYLCYSDFVLYRRPEMHTVCSSEVIENFYGIRSDLVRLTYSAHMMELIEDTVVENQPAGRILQLLLNTLHILSNTNRSPELALRVFELKLLCLLGYAPLVNTCVSCGEAVTSDAFFSFQKCGLVCTRDGCGIGHTTDMHLSSGAVKAVIYIVNVRMEDLFSFNLSEEVLEELGRLTTRYLRERLEKTYRKLDFLKGLDKEAAKGYSKEEG